MMPTGGERLTYCIANVTAVLAALYIAFWLDLDRPYWAMFTVFVVSKPISGAVRAKGVYRFAGTLVGASMSVFLVPPLVQSPVLLSLAVSLWIGICLFAALQDRTPRSYAFLLAGYSVGIVALPAVGTPTAIFDMALSRLEEISIGIVCAAVAHSVFFPRNFGDILRAKAERALSQSAHIVAKAVGSNPSPPSLSEIAAVASSVTDLRTLYSQIGFETSNVARVPGIMVGLLDRLAIVLPAASLAHRSIITLEKMGEMPDGLRSDLRDISIQISAIAENNRADTDTVLATLSARSEMLVDEYPTEPLALQQLVISRVAELVDALAECQKLAIALNNPAAAKDVSQFVPDRQRRPFYRDQALAFLSAIAASAAVLVACALWIEGGSWPEGFVAAQFTGICCSLFATLDNPSKIIGLAVTAIVVALPVAAVYEFAILPGIDGFASLALVLTPMLLLFSYLQTFERLEGAALALSIGFAAALALQETYASDFASFVNSNLSEIIGALIALAMLLIFRTIDPVWNARRILKAGRTAVSDLARRQPDDIKAWIMQMFDRIGLAATRLIGSASGAAQRDLLRDLRVGLGIADLDRCRTRCGLTISAQITEVLHQLSELYGDTLNKPASLSQADLPAGLIRISAALADELPSEERQEGIIALIGLRLDLDPLLAESGSAS
jgi:uncharacterized membrane protein YccC